MAIVYVWATAVNSLTWVAFSLHVSLMYLVIFSYRILSYRIEFSIQNRFHFKYFILIPVFYCCSFFFFGTTIVAIVAFSDSLITYSRVVNPTYGGTAQVGLELMTGRLLSRMNWQLCHQNDDWPPDFVVNRYWFLAGLGAQLSTRIN